MEDQIQAVSTILYETLSVESRNEKERIKLAQSPDFYSEVAFNYLKTYERPKNAQNRNTLNDFFDFSQPPDQVQYNFIMSLKDGLIQYDRIIRFIQTFGIQATDKQLEGVFEQFAIGQHSLLQQGINYEIFLAFIAPFSIPQAKHELLRRKVIYETKGLNEQIKDKHLKCIAEMLHSELDLLRHTSNLKLKLLNEYNWEPLKVFEILDGQRQGFLNFDTIQNLFRQTGKHFTPRDYLCLLRRMNKPEDSDLISFQDFNSLMGQNMPYFHPQNPNQSSEVNRSQLYQTTNKFKSPKKGDKSSIFQSQNQSQMLINQSQFQQSQQNYFQNQQDNLYFVDEQGRILQKPHPQQLMFAENLPEVNQIIKRNPNLAQVDPNIYPILPPSQYDAENYDPAYQPAIIRKRRQLDEQKEKNKFWTQTGNFFLKKQNFFYTEANREMTEEIRADHRQRIFQTKDQMMSQLNPQAKKQFADTHPMFGEIYRIAQNNTVRKQLDVSSAPQNIIVNGNLDNNQYKKQNLYDIQKSAMNITQGVTKDQFSKPIFQQQRMAGGMGMTSTINPNQSAIQNFSQQQVQSQFLRNNKPQSKIFEENISPRVYQYQLQDNNPQPARQVRN